VGRDPVTFGSDADIFRPERWLEAENEKDGARLQKMNNAVDMIFGHGKFLCLGRNLAYMELGKVLVELFRRFDFSIVNPFAPMKIYDGGFLLHNDFWLRVTRRVDAC